MTPDPLDVFEDHPAATLILALFLFVLAGAVVYIFARLVINSLAHATRAEQPVTTLMAILGTLSVVALVGALFTRDESAFTIAATGMGAFAGALTARSQDVVLPTSTEPPEDRPTDDEYLEAVRNPPALWEGTRWDDENDADPLDVPDPGTYSADETADPDADKG